jgi:hypothetical protein
MGFHFKKVVLRFAVVILAIVLTGVAYCWVNRPISIMPYKHPPMIFSDYSPSQITVAQGSTFQVNITLTCYLDTELSLPLKISR